MDPSAILTDLAQALGPETDSGRKEALDRFLALGVPHRRQEAWRFTNLKPVWDIGVIPAAGTPAASVPAVIPQAEVLVIPFSGGRATDIPADLPEGLSITRESGEVSKLLQRAESRSALSSLNSIFYPEVLRISVSAGAQVEMPVILAHSAGAGQIVYPRVEVQLEAGATLTLLEWFSGTGAYGTNTAISFHVGTRARLQYQKVQNESVSAWHVATRAVRVAEEGDVLTQSFEIGASLSRSDLLTEIAGTRANAELNALLFGDKERVVDVHSRVEHRAEDCTSFQDYKGIMADKSRAIFSGRIFVDPVAQLTDAKQSNNNMLLSRDALVHANPELEIYADDVKCTHGATVGEVDEKALFYLRSRGVPRQEAFGMLVAAFAGTLTERVEQTWLRSWIEQAVASRLPALAEMQS